MISNAMNDDSAASEQHLLAAAAAAASSVSSSLDKQQQFHASEEDPPQPALIQRSRKRQRPTVSTTTLPNNSESLHTFQHSRHSLRLSASSIAGLCGLHPYQDLPQLFFDLLYQSHAGQLLLQNDASLLGLQLIDAKSHEREQMLALASRVSQDTAQLVQTALAVSEGTTKLHSVDEVHSLQTKIRQNAIQSDKLSKQEVSLLVEASRGNMARGFGTMHEEEALDLYERKVGWRVRERNEAMMTWKFERVESLEDDGGVCITARPMGKAKRREIITDLLTEAKEDVGKIDAERSNEKSDKHQQENEVVVIDNGRADTAADQKIQIMSKYCFFKIVGAVDGIRDEVYIDPAPIQQNEINNVPPPTDNMNSRKSATSQTKEATRTTDVYNFSDEEDESNEKWTIRPIIVECKHRMTQAKVPPPLYDQIQTCLYMNMYCVEEADLIQVVKKKKKKKQCRTVASSTDTRDEPLLQNVDNNLAITTDKSVEGKENDQPVKQTDTKNDCREDKRDEQKIEEAKNTTEITISRISLNDPIHNHQHHWNETLLPRLASFVDAVYNVRKDDGKRYRLLMALAHEQSYASDNIDDSNVEAWKVLWEEMPWLRFCDTSFQRSGKR